MIFRICKIGLSAVCLLFLCPDLSADNGSRDKGYIFSSFRGNGESGLHLSYSLDGLEWKELNRGKSLVSPSVGGQLMRDPCILLGPDNQFHMVWTSGWNDRGIGIAHSKDLINWSEQRFVPVMEDYPFAKNAWAPEIIWDEQSERYLIFWASTVPGSFPETEEAADKGWNHRIYATTTNDFINYSDSTLYFEPGFNVIDSSIVKVDEGYSMILKDETRYPPAKNLRVATSDRLAGPWELSSEPFSPEGVWVEGPTAMKMGDWHYVYFDKYIDHQYGLMRSKDFTRWEDISPDLKLPDGTRHGTVLAVDRPILDKLIMANN